MPFSISQQVANTPSKIINIGHGESAMMKTMDLMRGIIVRSAKDYYVRRWAEKITEGTGRHDMPKLMAIYDFLSNNVQYCKDIEGTELLKTPKLILQLIEMNEIPQIDCDCMTMLVLSLAKSIGLSVAMRAVALPPKTVYSHIYGLVKIRDRFGEQWIAVDLTRPDLGLGWEHPGATKVKTMVING